MADITFKGTTIPFGKHRLEPIEAPTKKWGYPGVDGTDYMWMGKRDRQIVIEGRHHEADGADPMTESTMQGWMDGTTGSLVTGTGTYTVFLAGFQIMDVATDQDGITYRFLLFFEEPET